MCARGRTRQGCWEAWLQLEHMLCPPPPHTRPAKQTVLITLSLWRGEVRAEGPGQREAGGGAQAAWGHCFSNPVVLQFLLLAPEKPGVTGEGVSVWPCS